MFPTVIPVAGLGTRSLPASKVIPKEMLPVYDRPVIQWIVEEALAGGSPQIVFVTSRGKSTIEDHFDIHPELEKTLREKNKTDLFNAVYEQSRKVNFVSVRQKEALGLGHAVLTAEPAITSSHFYVMLGDEMVDHSASSLTQLYKKWESIGPSKDDSGVIMLMKVLDSDVSKYGISELEDENQFKILSCIEKPKPTETTSRWAITGRYLLPKNIFEDLKKIPKGALQEIQLTDALQSLAKRGKLYGVPLEGTRLDAGDRMGYLRANIHYYLKSSYRNQTLELLKDYKT